MPLSESGAWSRANNQWTSVQTVSGAAFGTNGVTNSYDDSYALLTGTFGADQTAEAVVVRNESLSPGPTHEVELLLRFSDDTNNARGYECLFSWYGGIQLFRWNGAFGDFTALSTTGTGSLGRNLRTGDVLKASIVGSVITVFINGVELARATDSVIKTGRPGISFFVRPGGSQTLLGFSSYSVTSK